MTKAQVNKLNHGLYHITWKSGGFSLAAVGSTRAGDRWLAPCNWTTFEINGVESSRKKLFGEITTDWREVKYAKLLEGRK